MSDNNQSFDEQQTRPDEVFDTTGLLLEFLAKWKWFVVSVVVFIVGAYFYIATIIPTYKVNASIYLQQQNQEGGNAMALDPKNPLVSVKTYIDETELEIMKSGNNLIHIVDSLRLAYTYYKEGNLRDIPLYQNNTVAVALDSVSLLNLESPILVSISNGDKKDTYNVAVEANTGVKETKEVENVTLPVDIDVSQGTITVTKVSHMGELDGTEKVIINNPRAVATDMSHNFDIAFADKAPTIVRISYYTPVITEGVDVVNTLIDFYNQQIIADKNRSAIQTEAFILDRLVNINDELRDVEQRLQEYRERHNISDLSQQVSTSLAAQTSSENQLAQVEADRQLITSIESTISHADAYTPLPSVSSDNTLNSAIEAYNRKVGQLNRLLETSTSDNPVVSRLQEDLQRDKSRIISNVASVKSSINTRRNSIAAIEGRSVGTLSATPTIDKGLQEIFREQQVKVNIYTFLLQKREEIALQKTLATPTARLIDDPQGEGPVAPRRMSIYFVALLLGLALPAGIIFLRRMLFPVFKDEEELQRLTKVPVISEICVAENEQNNAIVVGENVTTPIAELFRLLRNNIRFTKNGADKKVILVTSSISGEGKTFVAVNLAMTYALTGKKVVVVGMDIRRPVLAHRFHLNNQKGVTTFLSGQEKDIRQLLQKSEVNDNLYVLPAGPVPPNPNELLLSENMRNLMDQLRQDFDYVIIDTAPIGVVSDTFLIVQYSDIQIYVARAAYSTKNCIKVLHQAVFNKRLPEAYIVINGVNIKSGAYQYRKYGHYGHGKSKVYGYGYGYGYGKVQK